MKIAFTGGGTAGHAMVNTILIPYLQKNDCQIIYLGSHNGMEKEMLQQIADVTYWGISTGKLRRYLSVENLKDFFRVIKGYTEAYKILKKEKPNVLYSGGGYVSVPVVLAARRLSIPVLIRETDYTMGLANRICEPFAQTMYVTFPETMQSIRKCDSSYPGTLVRPILFRTSSLPAVFPASLPGGKRPLCLILGGSSGSKRINETVWNGIDSLCEHYDVIHICGRGNVNSGIGNTTHYQQYEYVYHQISDFLNAADVVVTRCGSNAIWETLALGKRTVCIPITTKSSRGEQEQNAAFAVENGNAVLLKEEEMDEHSLHAAIQTVLKQEKRDSYVITEDELHHTIKNHVEEIYQIALIHMQESEMITESI